MQRLNWRVVVYLTVLLSMAGILAWFIATCGCQQP